MVRRQRSRVVFAAMAPPTVATVLSLYQMSMFVLAISTLLELRAWTKTRLMPG